MENQDEPLGKRLRRLREAKKLSAKEVARAIGVPESTYREWEYGRGLKLPPFAKISQMLSISVTELVTGKPSKWQSYIDDLNLIEVRINELRLKMNSLL